MKPAPTLTIDGITLPIIDRATYATALQAERTRIRDANPTEPVTVGGKTKTTLVEDEPGPLGYRIHRHTIVLRCWVGPTDGPDTWLGYVLTDSSHWTGNYCGRYQARSTRSVDAVVRNIRRRMLADE